MKHTNTLMMCVKIFTVTFYIIFLTNDVLASRSDEEYVDSVISMLLNGESIKVQKPEEHDQEHDLALIGGVWKCGNCADVDHSKLVYSEVNDLEADFTDGQPVEVQISLSIPAMSCVAVVGERAGLVRRVTGACVGAHVTLSIAASGHFTVNVYAQ